MGVLPPDDPVLGLTPSALDFGQEATVLAFNVRNIGTGVLSWDIDDVDYAGGDGWISINPDSGNVAAGEAQTVTVTVSREGLDPETYTAVIEVASNGGDGSVDVSMEVLFPDEPAPPTELSAEGGDSVVNLSWTGSDTPGVVSHRIYRANLRGRWEFLAEEDAGVDSYRDDDVENGKIYWYAARAVDGEGRIGRYSDQANATPQPPGADSTPPAAPAGLRAFGETDRVFLSWAANTEPDLDRYHVYSRTDARRSWEYIGEASAPDTQFFHLNLTPGVTYYYVVTAIDEFNNESADSSPVSANPGRGGDAGSSLGCFIATTAFGSYEAREVTALRKFRDNQLVNSSLGRSFINTYYKFGPAAGEAVGGSGIFRRAVRLHLKPFVLMSGLFAG